MSPDVPPHRPLDDEVGATRALRARGRRWAVTLGANVALLAVLLGGPYVRGRLRTRALWPRFAEAAACILGGRPADDPGLGLPSGAREAFAARVLGDDEGWPARCTAPLRALMEPQVIFLLPSVKSAELDVDATVELVEGELAALANRPPGTQVPQRPLLALEKLRAALARHAQAAGVLSIPEGDAIVLRPGDQLPAATRVPLYAAADAEVAWSGTSESLTALALDRRGLSFVEVRDGGLIEHRESRPGRLRSVAGDPGKGTTLVWAMRPTTCDERDDDCATKSVGVAALALPFEALPDPRWLAAHPAGRGDRSVWREGGRVQVLASSREDAVVVREFGLPDAPPAPDAPPLGPATQWPPVRGAGDGLLIGGQGALVHREGQGDVEASFWHQAPGEAARLLASLPGEGAWSIACSSGRAGAFGTLERLRLWRLAEGDSVPELSPAVHVPLEAAVHAEWPSLDRVRVVCGSGGEPVWLGRAADDHLALVRCQGDDCDKSLLASHVQFFDAVETSGHLLVAYAGIGPRAQVMTRVVRLDRGGALEMPRAPDPCWEGGGGMCGLPRLLAAGDRVLVGAREGSDMRVMESRDGGLHWTPMRGLRKAAAP